MAVVDPEMAVRCVEAAFEHSSAGAAKLVAVLARVEVTEVAIQRPTAGGQRAVERGRHRGHDQPQPAEEPARPLGGGRRR